MKEIISHKVNGLNEAINIYATDEPGPGGARHKYTINIVNGVTIQTVNINFQNGPIKEAGINGISNEAILALVEDRLTDFQAGEFKCKENACALTHIQEAMMWLHKRTHDRMRRGVEGTNQK